MSTATATATEGKPLALLPATPALGPAVRVGLVGGVVAVYLAAVGMVGRFDERHVIIDVIRLSWTFLLIVAMGCGYIAARKAAGAAGGRPLRAVAAGALSAAVTGAVLGALVLLGDVINVRRVFVSISPVLLDLLAFGQAPTTGALLLVLTAGAAGALGGGISILPSSIRRAVLIGAFATLLISLLEPLLSPILDGLSVEPEWLYESGGLALSGAILVFVVATAVAYIQAEKGAMLRERYDEAVPEAGKKSIRIGLVVALLVALIALPVVVGGFGSDVLGNVGLYVLLGLGLNIVVGYAGLLDLGYVAFFAVGAYTTAVLTSRESFLVTDENLAFAESGLTNFWVALPIVVVVAVVIGVLIGAPVLRLRGDYLAIVTLGFGEIVRTLVLSDWLSPWLGGAQGIIQIPAAPPESFELRDPERLYYLILAFCLLAAYISYRLADSRVGRAWAAMREDESVAEAMGISVIKYKLLAFAMGAGVGCLGGAFFTAKIGSVFPNSFELLVSINVLAVLVLGGMGSIPGVVVGAFVLVGLPQLLREFAEFRLLIFGAVLVAIMILRPEGLIPNVRRRRELRAEVPEEEQFERRTGEDTGAPVITPASPGGGDGT